VWAEVKGPAGSKSRRNGRDHRRRGGRKDEGAALRIVEPAAQRGRRFRLDSEVTVGRAAGCQVTLDDHYASQIHARVFLRDDQLLVEDLGSTNGTYLNRQKVSGPMVIHRGDRLQVGNTIMELV
jgi:pSer/pThr/pTyr-binding forkhead associated (FHA) protein